MKSYLVSVIIPCYNCKDKLEPTLLSVLNQNTDLVECIVIDSNSYDGTEEILNKYNKRVKYISEKDNGIYDAMNKGIDLSCGKYLYFLGAGDILCKNIFNELNFILKKNKYDFIYGNTYTKFKGNVYNKGIYSKFRIAFENICHQGIFYKRDIFNKFGKYNLKYKVYADYELNIKCMGCNKIKKYYVDKFICCYEGNGFSNKYKDLLFNRDLNNIIKKNLGYYYYVFKVIFENWFKALKLN